MTKGDAGLAKELRKALMACKGCNDCETLNHLKMIHFKHKLVSVAEATYRLLNGLCLKRSNIACTFIATGFPKNRSSFFKPVELKEKSNETDAAEPNEDMTVDENDHEEIKLPGRNKKFKEVPTIHKKYAERPSSLDDVCLAQFATSYRSINATPEDTDWNDNVSFKEGLMGKFGKNEPLPKFIELTSVGKMVVRMRPIIIRIHSSKNKTKGTLVQERG